MLLNLHECYERSSSREMMVNLHKRAPEGKQDYIIILPIDLLFLLKLWKKWNKNRKYVDFNLNPEIYRNKWCPISRPYSNLKFNLRILFINLNGHFVFPVNELLRRTSGQIVWRFINSNLELEAHKEQFYFSVMIFILEDSISIPCFRWDLKDDLSFGKI